MGTAKQGGMGMMIAENKYQIQLYSMLALRARLKLEMVGMKGRGRTAYSLIKEELGIKGDRQKVLNKINEIIQVMKEQKGEIND